MTPKWRGLLFRPRPYTDDMVQMMQDLGVEPSNVQIGIDYGSRESWSVRIEMINGDILRFSREMCLS